MKSQEVIDFFLKNCSYLSQVYESLSGKKRILYRVIFLVIIALGLLMEILSWIYNKSIFYPVILIVLVIIAAIIFIIKGREVKTAEQKYCDDHGNPIFDEISCAKLKSFLRKKGLLTRNKIEVLKMEVESEIKNMRLNIITFFAIAAVIFGSIFSAFVQQWFTPINSIQSLKRDLLVLLFMTVLGHFICKSLVPAKEFSLMLNKKYSRHAGLKKLLKLLSEILLELKNFK